MYIKTRKKKCPKVGHGTLSSPAFFHPWDASVVGRIPKSPRWSTKAKMRDASWEFDFSQVQSYDRNFPLSRSRRVVRVSWSHVSHCPQLNKFNLCTHTHTRAHPPTTRTHRYQCFENRSFSPKSSFDSSLSPCPPPPHSSLFK